jgi:hypothetical protein
LACPAELGYRRTQCFTSWNTLSGAGMYVRSSPRRLSKTGTDSSRAKRAVVDPTGSSDAAETTRRVNR